MADFDAVAERQNCEARMEAFAGAAHTAFLGALEEAGEKIREDWRQSIGTAYPPASEAGTPPHRRTGKLQAGVQFIVHDAGGEGCMLDMGETREGTPMVPGYLEEGTPKMAARPHARPQFEKWAEQLPEIIPEMIRQRMQTE